jgi:3-isopropylmalate dehydrogenase
MVSSRRMKVAVLAGDGIGPEVTGQSLRILDWFIAERGLAADVSDVPYGMQAYKNFGALLPEETRDALRGCDAVLFGATGAIDTLPAEVRHQGSLLAIRASLELYANLRPITTMPALYAASPFKNEVLEGVDFMIVRELTGGIYFGQPRGVETLANGERRGINTHTYTTSEIHRIARVAFELARTRSGRVCSVDKCNVMEAGQFWREEVTALHAKEFFDVQLTHLLADNCAMQIVRSPAQFDVIVTDNLFGDLLSDCAAPLAGSLGMLPSASLGPLRPDGSRPALYEPVHGSAPDIAGKGIANPLASILSLAMALRYTFEAEGDAVLLEQAVRDALATGARTGDIMHAGARRVGTREIGDLVLQALDHRKGAIGAPSRRASA